MTAAASTTPTNSTPNEILANQRLNSLREVIRDVEATEADLAEINSEIPDDIDGDAIASLVSTSTGLEEHLSVLATERRTTAKAAAQTIEENNLSLACPLCSRRYSTPSMLHHADAQDLRCTDCLGIDLVATKGGSR